MSASRTSSMRALQRLASNGGRSSAAATQVRCLHMLDPAVFPATTRKATSKASSASEQSSQIVVAPRQDTASLSTSSSPATPTTTTAAAAPSSQSSNNSTRAPVDVSFQSRHFTTSRPVSAARDTSTIDFAHLPQFYTELGIPDSNFALRVPLVPWNIESTSSRLAMDVTADEEFSGVHRPIISTVSGEGTHIQVPSAMSELGDAASASFDIHELGASLRSAARNSLGSSTQHVGEQVQKAQGVVRQVWNDMVDDVFGKGEMSSSSKQRQPSTA